MNAAALIDAKERGVTFDRILHAIECDRENISALPNDQLEFLEAMLVELKKATVEFEQAVKSDDVTTIKKTSTSMKEIFEMVLDSCESSSETNK